ncbi:Ubiquitin-like protein 7 [Eumeta japonica]|uniref:Ubiquitin-like protein 7 n=1 Tax=Eumeta variegata TaxID=151549 RepID=A0A4C1T0N2_EUMVA|nr:Ubiquitin-like protein 7 [Eumeta japonica]
MENSSCLYLGVKVKPGPIERFKVENLSLDNTVDCLRAEAEKKTNLSSSSLELIHHGKVLKDNVTLLDSGIKHGEMIHVVKKKTDTPQHLPQSFTDAELQQIVVAVRHFCYSPAATGWARAMQMLNDESVLAELREAVPSLGEDCVVLSILNEMELIATVGLNINILRRAAQARPELPTALRLLTRLVRSQANTNPSSTENVPPSGFVYSLEALSEDEDADDEESEEGGNITREQLAAALQEANDTIQGMSSRTNPDSIFRFLQTTSDEGSRSTPTNTLSGSQNVIITPEMFSEAITDAMNRANSQSRNSAGTPMEQSTAASSSQSPGGNENYTTQLQYMNEMGLLDNVLNLRALLICAGDVNAAINLVFSGAIGDE